MYWNRISERLASLRGGTKAGEGMARRKKLINNTPYPDYVIETVARCLWPDIQALFESEEGQREFAEWKAEQEKKKQMVSTDILAA